MTAGSGVVRNTARARAGNLRDRASVAGVRVAPTFPRACPASPHAFAAC